MDAPRPAVRLSASIVEIRALGSHAVAIFRSEKYSYPIAKKIPRNLKKYEQYVVGVRSLWRWLLRPA